MKPCYVTGKGMHASATTWSFKTAIITMLEQTGLGFDTRFQYYRHQFPTMDSGKLARLICDPMEFYDLDWPEYRDNRSDKVNEDEAATAFMLARDNRFRAQAEAVIACYDEAGFGSGVNAMYFLTANRPVLGFYKRDAMAHSINLSNLLQLTLEYPELFTLIEYQNIADIIESAESWLRGIPD